MTDMIEPTDEVMAAVKQASSEGRISCARLRRLAEEMQVSYEVAGAAADELGIRVANCDLGCF